MSFHIDAMWMVRKSRTSSADDLVALVEKAMEHGYQQARAEEVNVATRAQNFLRNVVRKSK